MTENGCRAFITVETSCAGKVNGLGGGYGARVSDSPSTDAVQEDNRRETALGIHAPGGDPCTYKMVLPIYGGPRKCPVEECWGQAET